MKDIKDEAVERDKRETLGSYAILSLPLSPPLSLS